ncbi:helix-turn-helix transcriptional regulator [Kitasatospora sp. NRRL B-11411]|uniref:helix-turn-helix domain-containing protein n=1 Tax=Kitasatospora sp. NRRL B-11411 TaxID=1463822 RepID=UPI000A54CDE3|nr:helix-turn-helix transcriptional regulator [Kitasatospora sp. NRRL B-11411]
MTEATETDPVEQAAEAFAAEVSYWREVRGLSMRSLAGKMGFDPSYVSHIESGRHRPTEEFARLADEVLNAGKAVWRRWTEFDGVRLRTRPQAVPPAPRRAEQPYASGSALVVEHDEARLRFDDGVYRLTMRRRLRNTGGEPNTRSPGESWRSPPSAGARRCAGRPSTTATPSRRCG